MPETSVHLVLGGARALAFVAREILALPAPARVRAEVRRQVEAARARGLVPTRLDTHRHLAFPRATFRAVCAEARALGLREVRRPVPLGTLRVGRGAAGFVKGALLAVAGLATRGLPRAYGLDAPDGFADLEVVDGWVRRGTPAPERARSAPRGRRAPRARPRRRPPFGAGPRSGGRRPPPRRPRRTARGDGRRRARRPSPRPRVGSPGLGAPRESHVRPRHRLRPPRLASPRRPSRRAAPRATRRLPRRRGAIPRRGPRSPRRRRS